MRPLALGRKNFLFCGNHDAAEDTAVIYTFMGCCKLAQVDVRKWLNYFFTHVHDYDNDSLTGALAYQLRKKYPVIATIPEDYDMSQAQEVTRCGRPCWIITLEEDTALGRGHLVSTLWLDKEYCFLYSVSIKGTNDLGNIVDMESFEVTYFTDAPTGKDIPDPAQTGGGVADDMKKQLQEQIDALTK